MTKINSNNNNFDTAFKAFKEKHGYEFNYQFVRWHETGNPSGAISSIKKKLFFLGQKVTIKKIKQLICKDFNNLIKGNKYNPKDLIIKTDVKYDLEILSDNKKIDLKNIALKRFLVFWKH